MNADFDIRAIISPLFFFSFGTYFFFWGFMRLRRKRLIENIPTSKIRGLAMGLVEIIGAAKKSPLLMSPLSKTGCVFYRYQVERLKQSGKSSKWVTIACGDSTNANFIVDDTTGSIIVGPKGAEIILPLDYEFTTNLGTGLPDALVSFMESNRLSYKNIFGTYKLRFREWFIKPDQTVYVLGFVQKNSQVQMLHEIELTKRIEELKNDSRALEECDIDKDGNLSEEEWVLAKTRIEQKLLEEELKSTGTGELNDVIISKGQTEKVFIISDQDQKSLLRSLFWQSLAGIFLGALLALACFWWLVFYLTAIIP